MLDIVKHRIDDILYLLENTGYYLINEQKKGAYKKFQKEDGSLLTELDLASEYLIKNELKSLFGDIGIISEENNEKENIDITNNKYCFLLDPIDGTKNFDKGKDFTINLAFCVERKPIIGFIYNPIKKTLLFGDGNNAFKKKEGKINKLNCLVDKDKYDIIVRNNPLKIAIGINNFLNQEIVNKFISSVQSYGYNFSRYGLKGFSAMEKLISFVDLEVDCFITSKCCKDWDILPAIPIVKAIKTNFWTENETLYKNYDFNSGVFIVSKSKELLIDLIEIAKKF